MQHFPQITTNEQGSQVVSARELYEFLEVKTKFTDWCARMFEYGLAEGEDYILLPNFEKQTRGGHNAIDYALTLDTAKEIAMLQRTEKGKQARQYFIECEKRLRQSQPPQISREQKIAEALMLAQGVLAEKDAQIKMLTPKAEFTDIVLKSQSCHTVTEIAKELGMTAIELNKKLCERGIQYKHRDHYVLYAQYNNKGYTDTETRTYFSSNGEVMSRIQMVWTEYGRVFIHSLFNSNLSFSKAQKVA